MFIGTDAVATQAYVTGLGYITSSALTPYLTSATAASTYLTTATAASTYLTTSSASSTYLTTSSASSTYQPIITAGTGLTKSGNTLSVNAAQTQITSVGTLTGLTSSGIVNVTNTTASTTTTGAFQVTGGVNIGQSLFVSNRGIFGYSLGASQTYANGYINTDTSTVNIVSKTNNGAAGLSAPEPVLNLVRNGVSGQSWSNFATFYLSRYENSGISARTQLDISLTHDDLALGSDTNTKVFQLKSRGDLTITGNYYSRAGHFIADTTTVFDTRPGTNWYFRQTNFDNIASFTDVAYINSTGSFVTASDASYKDNIADNVYGLQTINKLRPVSYLHKLGGKKRIQGLVA